MPLEIVVNVLCIQRAQSKRWNARRERAKKHVAILRSIVWLRGTV